MGNTLTTPETARIAAVHPHGRGEHGKTAIFNASSAGSSPRAWGTPPLCAALPLQGRFIPTGVGNTFAHLLRTLRESVHPHGRGEHELKYMGNGDAVGSSPRAWGTRGKFDWMMPEIRFIPTGVGNTASRGAEVVKKPVHPHGRGEHCLGHLH